MTVTVEIDAVFSEFTEGERKLELNAATVQQLVDELTTRHPLLRAELLNPDGGLKGYVELLCSAGGSYSVLDLGDDVPAGSTVTVGLEQIAGG
jgi:hypothetical protein